MSGETVKQGHISEKEAARQNAGKKLAEMNLLDDFLFSTMATYPEIGERFVKILLKIIFGREFKRLHVTAQKVFYGADTNLHGARLDVYLEPEIEADSDEKVTVYDIEPDQKDSLSDKRALPRRMRFYHAKIAVKNLNAGADYDELKNAVIIMIMPYDPFGLGRTVYTIKNKCVEVPEMPYEDGASTLFLYTKGTEGAPDEALKQLLHYMEHTTGQNAVNEELRELHGMVSMVKKDPEVTAGYMIRYLRMMEEFNKIRAEGLNEGRTEGRSEGILYNRTGQICKKLKKGKTLEEIAEDLEEEISVIEPIYRKAKEFAPDYDLELVFEQIREDN